VRVLFCIIRNQNERRRQKVSTKLKNLKVTSVDLVDQGANQDAYVRLFKRKDEDPKPEKSEGVLKKFASAIAKALSLDDEELEARLDGIEKANTFNQEMLERQMEQISDEIWNMLYALRSSLCSILWDESVVNKEQLMNESVDQFKAAMADSIKNWSNGKSAVAKGEQTNEPEEEVLKSALEFLEKKLGNKEATGNGAVADINPKGEEVDMKFEKSKMSPEERAMLEELEKKYGMPDDGNAEQTSAEVTAETPATEPAPEQAAPEAEQTETQGDDVYKGLNPIVQAELAELKKFKEAAEEKELREVAKRYEVIGKKAEELVPKFKSLKKAGGTAYDDMIAVLDAAVETVNKSGIFSEIGKSGHQDNSEAKTKIEGIAKGMMEKDNSLSYDMAIAKAWEEHPEIMAEYDEEFGI